MFMYYSILGMVIGESARTGELDVNPCKAKKLSNVRSTGAEEKVLLTPPKRMTVEEGDQIMLYLFVKRVLRLILYALILL